MDHEPDLGLRPSKKEYDESTDLILDQEPAPLEFSSLLNGEWRYKFPKWWSFFKVSPTFGLLLVGMSGVTYGCQSAAIKYVGHLPTAQVIWGRFLIILTVSSILCISKGEPLFTKIAARWEVIFRCVFGILSFLCSTYAIQRLPVGEVTVIISIAPIFTAIGSKLMLKDKFLPVHFVCIILCIAGVIMVVDPRRLMKHASLDLLAVSVALLQPVFKSLAYIFIKRCNNQGIQYHVVLFYYSLAGFATASLSIIVTGFFLLISGHSVDSVLQQPSQSDNLALLLAGLLGFIAQYGINKGGMLANTTKCSLIRNIDVLIAFIFQIFMFHQVPTTIQVIGSVILLSSTILVVVWKNDGCDVICSKFKSVAST